MEAIICSVYTTGRVPTPTPITQTPASPDPDTPVESDPGKLTRTICRVMTPSPRKYIAGVFALTAVVM